MSKGPNDKVQRLTRYVEKLKQQLSSQAPAKYEGNPSKIAAWKQMIEIDLRKTQAVINKLKG